MIKETESYYVSLQEPQQSCLLALRSLILAQDENIRETQKYGMPCFCYRKNIFCYLWTDKKTSEPYILMAEGIYLNHPALEKGSRSRMKILKVDPGKNLPVTIIKEILTEGVALYINGIVKVK
ncbi:MAG: DUF1801 domain-containing protein [Tannerellaceae bacterium]|nr:DUF1801 domain-containing protein [Tannerellaceae bacterium]MCC8199676.1 DUF1801 domain-containing protein [Tannerellaceae bacterium]